VGAIEWSEAERAKAAVESLTYICPICGMDHRTCLPTEQEVPSQILEVEPEMMLTEPVLKESASADIDTSDSFNPQIEENPLKPPNEVIGIVPQLQIDELEISSQLPEPHVLEEHTPELSEQQTAGAIPSVPLVVTSPLDQNREKMYNLLWKVDTLIVVLVSLLIAYFFVKYQ
jgi:hypothetical protein